MEAARLAPEVRRRVPVDHLGSGKEAVDLVVPGGGNPPPPRIDELDPAAVDARHEAGRLDVLLGGDALRESGLEAVVLGLEELDQLRLDAIHHVHFISPSPCFPPWNVYYALQLQTSPRNSENPQGKSKRNELSNAAV